MLSARPPHKRGVLSSYPNNVHEEARPSRSKSLLSGRVASRAAVLRRREAMMEREGKGVVVVAAIHIIICQQATTRAQTPETAVVGQIGHGESEVPTSDILY